MRKASLLLPLLLIALALATAAGAETANTDRDRAVQSGDTLEIWLWNDAEEAKEYVVDAGGNVSVPPAGAIQVQNLTTAQIAERIAAALRAQHIKNPRVTVMLKTRRAESAFALGAVAKPGAYVLTTGFRLRDLIGQAGGLAPDADGANATLSSPQKGVTRVDLDKLLVQGDESLNCPLSPGDVLTVPTRSRRMLSVIVVGQVTRPGTLEMAPGTHLSDAMVAAGGPTPTAALKKASLARGGTTTTVNLDAILRKGDLEGNLAVQDGDVILVPEGRNQVTLLGEFTKPGTYPFQDGDTLVTAMALGGGPSPTADLRQAVLKRADKETPLDLQAMLKMGSMAQDQPLQDGDIILVPKARYQVTLVGEFMKPGTYTFQEGDTVVTAVALGGGPSTLADLSRATFKREGTETPLDLYAMLKQGDMKQDQALHDGDILVIPEGARIYAYGAFLKPGPVTVTRGMKLVDVLLLAGGATPTARLDKAEIVRMVEGKPVRTPLNIKVAVEKGGPGQGFEFQNGDVLVLPDKGQQTNWQGILGTVGSLWWLANLIKIRL